MASNYIFFFNFSSTLTTSSEGSLILFENMSVKFITFKYAPILSNLLLIQVILGVMKYYCKSRKETPQKLTQLSSRSHPRHLVGKRTAQKDTIIDITSDSQVNSNFPYRWSPASLTFNNYFYRFLYLYIT